MNEVTVVLTSCGRVDLLRKTIDSFIANNTYPIEHFIIIDDSWDPVKKKEIDEYVLSEMPDREFALQLISNKERLGQIRSIDIAYEYVITPYIFHMEDDWEFYRPGFIEKSMQILQCDKNIIQVWLRELNDTNNHPVEDTLYIMGHNTGMRYMSNNDERGFKGFSFNPGLKRLSDYKILAPYSQIKHSGAEKFHVQEKEIGQFYDSIGYRAVILTEGYVRHIGGPHHIRRDI